MFWGNKEKVAKLFMHLWQKNYPQTDARHSEIQMHLQVCIMDLCWAVTTQHFEHPAANEQDTFSTVLGTWQLDSVQWHPLIMGPQHGSCFISLSSVSTILRLLLDWCVHPWFGTYKLYKSYLKMKAYIATGCGIRKVTHDHLRNCDSSVYTSGNGGRGKVCVKD